MRRAAAGILVVLLATSGCGGGGLLDSLNPSSQPPVVDSFTASPLTISSGEQAVLSWAVSGAATVQIDQEIGSVALSGSRTVSPTTTTVYTLTAESAAGKSVTASAQVTVTAAPSPVGPPVIHSFAANPPGISPGASSTLNWEVSDAVSVTIDRGVGSVGSTGSASVSPTETMVYTLSATNAVGTSTATARVEVAGGTPGGPPVIVSFRADPPSILPGGTSTLSWEVSGADSVALDRGIGAVGATGSRTVSVLATTNYTLTASNAAGHVYQTIPVLVTDWPSPGEGEPDLIITTIAKVAGTGGYRVGYTVRNQGDTVSPPSTSRLYVGGVYKASDAVPALDAGASLSRVFTSWTYSPTTMAVKIVADADDDVEEEDEDNNEKAVSLAAEVLVNLVNTANLADWKTGNPLTSISFGGALSDSNGFASHRTSVKLEDGETYAKVLETHPRWVGNGWIHGFYPSMTVPLGAWFVADVGFIYGATATDGASFLVWFLQDGSDIPSLLGNVTAYYDTGLDKLNIDLSPVVGKTGRIGIEVLAGTSSGQDWAVWVDMRIIR